MTVLDLIKKCSDAITDPNSYGEEALMVPGKARGETRRFMGVRGKIVCEYDNECLCRFDAQKLLDKTIARLPHVTLKEGDT